jgi:hypothetical protein
MLEDQTKHIHQFITDYTNLKENEFAASIENLYLHLTSMLEASDYIHDEVLLTSFYTDVIKPLHDNITNELILDIESLAPSEENKININQHKQALTNKIDELELATRSTLDKSKPRTLGN